MLGLPHRLRAYLDKLAETFQPARIVKKGNVGLVHSRWCQHQGPYLCQSPCFQPKYHGEPKVPHSFNMPDHFLLVPRLYCVHWAGTCITGNDRGQAWLGDIWWWAGYDGRRVSLCLDCAVSSKNHFRRIELGVCLPGIFVSYIHPNCPFFPERVCRILPATYGAPKFINSIEQN